MPVSAPSRLQRYLTVIVRSVLTLGLSFAAMMLAGQFITEHLLPQNYKATAQIQIRPHGVAYVRSLDYGMAGSHDPTGFQVDFSIMQSSEFLLPIIHDLSLEEEWAKRFSKSKDGFLTDDEALAHLNRMLKLDFVRGTNIINITVVDDVPKEAADIANAIADRYKTMRELEDDQRNNRGLGALCTQIAEQEKVVAVSKKALEKKASADAQRQLEEQQNVLDTLRTKVEQDQADIKLQQRPVRIISRAQIPTQADHPMARMVTLFLAIFLSIGVASLVETILLFVRAGDRQGN